MKKTWVLLMAMVLLTGCGENSSSGSSVSEAATGSEAVQTTVTQQTTATTATTDADSTSDLITGKYNNKDVLPEEAAIGVTAEKKAAFIEKNGYEIYDVAMQSLSFMLNYSANNSKKLSDTDFSSITSNYSVEAVTLESSLDGHTIPAELIFKGDKKKDTVVVVHGLGENRHQGTEQFELFLSMGYNVLTYDQRGAGENTAPYTTYGVLEHHDTIDCVKYVRGVIGDKKIVLFGKSMGGATAAMTLGDAATAKEISYAILDFPVGSFREMVRKNMKGYCPDEYMEDTLGWDDLFLHDFLGIGFDQGEVADYVKDTKVPVLIFSSTADEMVPQAQQQGIYDAIQGERKYIFVDKTAGHCGLFYTQPDKYRELVTKFLSGKLV